MSRQLALEVINLRPTTRWAHTEYSLEYHHDLIAATVGEPDAGRLRRFYDAWGLDFLWSTNHGLHGDWGARGRATDMGHAEYAADGSDRRAAQSSPFRTVDEVWAFDPVAEYGLPELDAQVAAYEQATQAAAARYPEQLTTGGYYRTIISGCIDAFGWEMLLLAASDRAKFEQVLDGFFRYTLHHMTAWAQTSAPVIIQHDDFVWTAGGFLHPEVYRRQIIPRFAELWRPLRAAGKKVLFCSDGDFSEYAGDILAAGADGLIFEPVMDFGRMAERYGDRACLVGSYVDCRDLTFGRWEAVKQGLDRTFEAARRCRGVILAVGNHLPANIPAAMMERYREHLMAGWRR